MTAYDPNTERAVANLYDDSIPGRDAWSRWLDRECARLEAEAELQRIDRERREAS